MVMMMKARRLSSLLCHAWPRQHAHSSQARSCTHGHGGVALRDGKQWGRSIDWPSQAGLPSLASPSSRPGDACKHPSLSPGPEQQVNDDTGRTAYHAPISLGCSVAVADGTRRLFGFNAAICDDGAGCPRRHARRRSPSRRPAKARQRGRRRRQHWTWPVSRRADVHGPARVRTDGRTTGLADLSFLLPGVDGTMGTDRRTTVASTYEYTADA